MAHQLIPEWALQQAVVITWPHHYSDWADKLADVEPSFLALAKAISDYQQLIIICYDSEHHTEVTQKLCSFAIKLERVTLYIIPSNDTWCRDYGPLSIQNNSHPESPTQLINFCFNAWGNKFASDLDNQINDHLAHQQAFWPHTLIEHTLILEGGSIETDGQGTLLTTSRCLLNPNRNHQLSQSAIEATLKESLGFKRILWLNHGELAGDDTDAHIDTLARFCDPHTLCYIQCTDENDEHFDTLYRMEQELKALTDYQGQPYQLIPLPLPHCYNSNGERLPSSYANFLITNHAVLVPTYRVAEDQIALQTLAACFKDRKIIPIDSRPFIEQGGSLHCLTMQIAKPI
ncbi:Putative agmatine deiminase [Piscirickettsia salmonis]|uniref:agmatine deiminase family protein n=1 Tax=Piscirickettsia salmonis TaxID=1238 RepID=UPI0012B735F7|nr:agmatine deiminase family protein [Piscirickettsia salmonis]QGP50478.1 Putative agmatine deiminase [Piscirickettsia salmonis]